jgi:DNA-binding transcriptional regulator YbjK
MSCYFHHMQDILDEAGIRVSARNKKQIDQTFHQIVGTSYKDCPATWKALKQTYLTDERKRHELIQKLQAAVH